MLTCKRKGRVPTSQAGARHVQVGPFYPPLPSVVFSPPRAGWHALEDHDGHCRGYRCADRGCCLGLFPIKLAPYLTLFASVRGGRAVTELSTGRPLPMTRGDAESIWLGANGLSARTPPRPPAAVWAYSWVVCRCWAEALQKRTTAVEVKEVQYTGRPQWSLQVKIASSWGSGMWGEGGGHV